MPKTSNTVYSRSFITQTLRWLGPAYPGRRLGLAAVVVCLIVGLLGRPATGALIQRNAAAALPRQAGPAV